MKDAGRGYALLLTIGGLIGLVAAAVLLVEKIQLIRNPSYVPSCSINPVLSCGSVMTTPQAEVFGFPNPLVGVAGFAAVATVGLALLAGASFARWFVLVVQAGATFGVVFVHWLIYQSLYVIGALCPYCMGVWVVMIAIFWHTTVVTLTDRGSGGGRVAKVARAYRGSVLTAWYLIIVGLIAHRFWSYWVSLL